MAIAARTATITTTSTQTSCGVLMMASTIVAIIMNGASDPSRIV